MKNIKIYIIAFLGIWMMTGCGESVIDLEPKDKFTIDVALSTVEGLEGGIYGVYAIGQGFCMSDELGNYKMLQTDIIMAGTHLVDQANLRAIFFADAQFNGVNANVKSLWDNLYIGINRANLIIEKGDEFLGSDMKDSEKARVNNVLGQALFFRAYYHYSLLSRWGNIILMTQTSLDPSVKIELVSKDVVLPVIIADLEKAIGLLPDAKTVNSVGRVSKGTARHLLAKMYLEIEDWTKAAETADAVINDAQYKLLDDLNAIFSLEEQSNSELIFSWQFSESDINNPQRISQHWYPLYDRIVGVDRSFEQGARPWSRFQPNEYYWSLFEENDKRLDAYHHRFWYYDSESEELPAGVSIGDMVKVEDGFTTSDNVPIERAITPTTAKYDENSDYLGREVNESSGYRNIIVYRLAETYVVAAEAYMRSGDNGKALEYLNALRQRAGVADLTSINQDVLLEEHARELGHEGHRYEMLKRLGLLMERVKAHNSDMAEYVQDYHINWPISATQVNLTGVPQNEGYNE
ncbi:MAG: RagB/SusD family nutrient uptake outer membrane protein [Prolixibacteraceae bacterium]|jgi:tetratricopeptide (TPR) repeat protein|nr:RagB/SusD family nutrient uptake outer membrane protein [Prolixibacteraceae bacterium]